MRLALTQCAALVLFVACACLMAEQPRGQISVPCEIVEVYDGDTMTVRVSVDLRVRLLDCWAPELKTKDQSEKVKGIASMKHLRGLAPVGSKAQLTIPLNGDRLDDVLTLGRVLGRVSVDGKDLAEQQVKANHARTSK